MDKLYFKTRKEEIQSKIDSCKKEMKELENEYIVSNQKFPIGSKVRKRRYYRSCLRNTNMVC